MTQTVEVIARTVLDVTDADGQARMVPVGGRVVVTEAVFAELQRTSAARKAEPDERTSPLDHDGDGSPGGSVSLKPKHVGSGKWRVVDQHDQVVSGDELFDSRDDAQEWIDNRETGDN